MRSFIEINQAIDEIEDLIGLPSSNVGDAEHLINTEIKRLQDENSRLRMAIDRVDRVNRVESFFCGDKGS